MHPETRFKNKLKPYLEEIPKSYFEKIQQVSIRGTPDILGVVNGVAVALELKVDAPLEALQAHKLSKWRDAGAFVRVVTPETYREVIEELIILGSK